MNPDLRQRILTAIIIGIFFIPALLYSALIAQFLFGFILVMLLFEYLKIGYGAYSGGFTYLFSGILLSLLLLLLSVKYVEVIPWKYMLIISVSLGLFHAASLLSKGTTLLSKSFFIIHALYYLTIPIIAVILYLSENEAFRFILFGIFLIIWISDSAAYFVGSKWGKRRLFPSVSPNKSWEGFMGAFVFGILAAWALSVWGLGLSVWDWLIIALGVVIFGTLGDLIESSIKRAFQIKDSGTILPGHGGFLDRFDSFIFAIPFVMIYLLFIVK